MEIAELYEEIYEYVMDESKWSMIPYALMDRQFDDVECLATHLFYGDRFSIDLSKVKTLRYDEWRGGNMPEEARSNTALISIYGDKEVEVGPRARLTLFKGFEDRSVWGLQRARFAEIKLGLKRIHELLSRIDPEKPGRVPRVVFGEGKGVGVYEAPRGTLIHWVEMGIDGRIASYQIVVPTMFNIPWMEKTAVGFPARWVDVIPRIYDPCIPCATHVIRVEG
jgi:coenzyme F420 hydrogenase subunit alpha